MDTFTFHVTNRFEEIQFDDEQRALLDAPSGLTDVLLLSNWFKQKHRLLDFTGTTNKEAIEKILKFYTHKTYRRCVGDHLFYEGIFHTDDGKVVICLGS
jgi:hypothetical protein